MPKHLCSAFWVLLASGVLAAEPAGRVEIMLLKPDKIVYDDGEDGVATVRLHNPGDEDLDVTLRPALLWDLEERQALPQVNLRAPAQGQVEAIIPLPGSTVRWGRELRVEAVVDGRTEDVGRQFYQVTGDWMDVILISFKRRHCPFARSGEPFTTYTTVHHWFAWAPGDYAENAPDYDEWYSGQTGYHMKKDALIATIREKQAQGIHCTFYNNAFTGGKAGLEWARRHPEWICRNRDGSPMLSGDPLMLTQPFTNRATGGNGHAHMSFHDEACIEWGAQNVIESIEMFGWDGMFWDCGGPALFPGFTYEGEPTPMGRDPNEVSARNFRRFHEIVREKHPRFGIWINGSWDKAQQPFWSRFGNSGGPIMLQEQMRLPQTALLSEFRHHSRPGSPFHNWSRTRDVYRLNRDNVIQPYGAPIIVGYTTFQEGYPAQAHLAAIILACQMRPANCHQEGSWPITQFMTRYSALLWDRNVRLVEDPDSLIEAELSRPVWWREHVYRRATGTGEDVMVHFVNQPVTENCDVSIEDDPPAATGKVTFTVPAGRKASKVFFLEPRRTGRGPGFGLDAGGLPVRHAFDPDRPDGERRFHAEGSLCRQGPVQAEWPFAQNGATLTLSLPEVIYHGMLVFRLEDAP